MASSAAPSGAAAAASARERRRFLERYGLNPDDFEDDAEAEPRVSLFGPSIRGLAEVDSVVVSGDLSLFFFFLQEERRRDRRNRRSGRGEAEDAPAKAAAEPRETHKMLQVPLVLIRV